MSAQATCLWRRERLLGSSRGRYDHSDRLRRAASAVFCCAEAAEPRRTSPCLRKSYLSQFGRSESLRCPLRKSGEREPGDRG
jgi:hypothetical protein